MPIESKERLEAASKMRLQSTRTFVLQVTQAYMDLGSVCHGTDRRQTRSERPRSFRMVSLGRWGGGVAAYYLSDLFLII